MIYIDESAIKEQVTRRCAYAMKEEKVVGKAQGKRPHKINIVAGINGNEMIAPFIFEGTVDSDLFNSYLYLVLLPLVAFEAIIIIDNAKYHLSEEG